VDEGSTTPADAQPTGSTATASDNQMQLLNLHYEVKRLTQFDQIFFNLVQEKMSTFFFFNFISRLEETVHTLLPLRHQQSALIQSYEVLKNISIFFFLFLHLKF
jgi:hypothetical protein